MFEYPKNYDVIVIGAGHAGIEAALASARLGCETLILTQNADTVAQMSCNPAIGGLAKGHIVREIDALGGVMALNTDATGIQFRMLNARKGPSVRAPRVQCDKKAYQFRMKSIVEATPNLDLKQGNAVEIETKNDRVTGITTNLGVRYHGKAIVVTTGTFMRGLMHVGLQQEKGGRMGDAVSTLSDCLKNLGFEIGRFKTGTPCRLIGKSIDFSQLEPQYGDEHPQPLSFLPERLKKEHGAIFTLNHFEKGVFHVEQLPCWTTQTNTKTHEIIRQNLDKSPMYSGQIKGTGTRYCPSIEDKIVRFAEKEQHQVFLEPEGLHTTEFYANGVSTSLPFEVQYAFIRSIPGLERAEIMRPGYAVEYDYCIPTQLSATLETKRIENLYFAGQINGTSGYEEAAGQGIMAGANAALKILEKPAFILGRAEAYIGVLIDDLITKGILDPYRMFTSRAEHRLLLRQDNADLRLTERAADFGLVDTERLSAVRQKKELLTKIAHLAKKEMLHGISLEHWLKRPENHSQDLPDKFFQDIPKEIWETYAVDVKYEGYITRQEALVTRSVRYESQPIPEWIDYASVRGLRTEAVQKLTTIRPSTIGQAGRISGITPADISLLAIRIKKGQPKITTIKH